MKQTEHRQYATFTIVIRTHHENDVLQADHDDDGPEKERQNAHQMADVMGISHADVMSLEEWLGKGCLEGVQGAGAEITEHDTHGAKRQQRPALSGPLVFGKRKQRWSFTHGAHRLTATDNRLPETP